MLGGYSVSNYTTCRHSCNTNTNRIDYYYYYYYYYYYQIQYASIYVCPYYTLESVTLHTAPLVVVVVVVVVVVPFYYHCYHKAT